MKGKVILAAILSATAVLPCRAGAGSNLLVNGSFDDKQEPLRGWRYKYDLPGESFYSRNHEYVSVVPEESGRRGVLRIFGTQNMMAGLGQGVQVDSAPVAFDPDVRYRLSAYVRSTGPDCRIYVVGHQWKPGIKPHAAPDISELREAYRGEVMRLSATSGPFSGTTAQWKKGVVEFPMTNLSDAAKTALKRVKFMTVHIIAIGGKQGEFFVDDVALDPIR